MTLAGCWLAWRDTDRWFQVFRCCDPGETILWWRWLFLAIAVSGIYGLVYLLNQIKDVKADAVNKKLFLISEGALSKRHIIWEVIVLIVIISICFVISRFTNLALLALVIFLITGIFYNFSPLALKQGVWGSLIAYLIGGWLSIKFGEMIYDKCLSLKWELPYLVAFVSSCLLTNIPDKEGDLVDGRLTVAVLSGERRTLAMGGIGFLLSAIIGLLNRDWVIALPSILTTPWMWWAYLKNDVNLSVRVNKWAIFLLSLTVGIAFKFPVYLIIIALYFPLARWYHKNRFGMIYPSFK